MVRSVQVLERLNIHVKISFFNKKETNVAEINRTINGLDTQIVRSFVFAPWGRTSILY